MSATIVRANITTQDLRDKENNKWQISILIRLL